MRQRGSGHRGRVFYGYLLSFLLILLVPVMMSLFLFRRANSVVTTESQRANTALLETTGTYLDSLLEDMNQLSYLVSYSNRLESMLYERAPVTGEEYFRAWELVEDFSAYRDSSTAVVDFYVYLPNLDMIISPSGYFTSRSYHMALRDERQSSYRSWLSSLAGLRSQVFRPSRLARVPGTNNTYVPAIELVIPLPLPRPGPNPRGWVVIQIDERPFRDQYDDTVWEDKSLFFVVDRNAGLMSSSDPGANLSPLLMEYQEVQSVPRVSEVTLSESPYVAFSRPSRDTGFNWNYVALIPRNLYASEFTQLRRFTIIAFVLCALIGGVLIYLVANARYKPIHDLLEMLQPGVDGTFTLRSDEFQMIRASLRSTLAEDRILRQEVVESRDLLLQRLLQQLLKGSLQEGLDADAKLVRMGFTATETRRFLVGLQPDLPDRSLFPELVSWIEETVARWPERSMVVRDVDGVICLLFWGDLTGVAHYMDSFRLLKTEIERRFAISCAVGVSAVHEPADGFHTLYQEVSAALGYRLVLGEREPIHVRQVLSGGQTYYYPIDEENKLINSIITGSYGTASRIVNKVFEANFSRAQLSVEMARCLMFDLISTMIKALESISSTDADAEFWSRTRPIRRLTGCHSLEQLRAEMDVILQAVCEHVVAGRSTHAGRLRDSIEAIVEANLHDRNLGPELVADRLKMNSAYVARVYREESGAGLSHHIKHLRTAEAKRLLVESSLTVREIAGRVGFSDSNALIRAFKSVEGLTPGEYRDAATAGIANTAPDAIDVRN